MSGPGRGAPPGRELIAPLALLIAFAALCSVVAGVDGDADLWGRMAYAREALAGGVPTLKADVYSYTAPGAPWVDHEWGFNHVAWATLRALGWPGLRLLRLVLLAATALLCLRPVFERRLPFLPRLLLFALIAHPLALGFYGPRAQSFSFLLFAWLLGCLERSWAKGPRWILYGVLPMPLWVNLHGGFLAGVGVAGLWGLVRGGTALVRRDGHTVRWLLAAGGWSAASLFVSPWGVRFAPFVARSAGIERPFIPEWDAPAIPSVAFFTAALLALLAAGRLWERPRRWPDLISLGVVAAVALRHQRHLPFLAIAVGILAVPFLIVRWGQPTPERGTGAPRTWSRALGVGVALLLAVEVISAGMLGWVAAGSVLRPAPREPLFPAAAVDFLHDRKLEGGIVVDFDWAQYVLFRAWPQVRVAFDGRYEEVYPPDVVHRYFTWHYGLSGWEALPADPRTRMALVAAGSARDERLSKLPGWTCAFRDARAALFVKAEARP